MKHSSATFAIFCTLILSSTVHSAASEAVGGPVLSVNEEQIFRSHFAELAKEETALDKEIKAIKKAMTIAGKRGDLDYRSALALRISELKHSAEEVLEARTVLTALKSDATKKKSYVQDAYAQIAQRALRHATDYLIAYSEPELELAWPVTPHKGISASFLEESYEKRFGIPHEAIDIPVPQGSSVFAAANGIVKEVHNRGYGYNTLVLDHGDGLTTVYGHVSDFRVYEGDAVQQGQLVALSGGRPGSRGAGFLTTGPHLHFEVRIHDVGINPLEELPQMMVASAK